MDVMKILVFQSKNQVRWLENNNTMSLRVIRRGELRTKQSKGDIMIIRLLYSPIRMPLAEDLFTMTIFVCEIDFSCLS